jgi:hypothetical protein
VLRSPDLCCEFCGLNIDIPWSRARHRRFFAPAKRSPVREVMCGVWAERRWPDGYRSPLHGMPDELLDVILRGCADREPGALVTCRLPSDTGV